MVGVPELLSTPIELAVTSVTWPVQVLLPLTFSRAPLPLGPAPLSWAVSLTIWPVWLLARSSCRAAPAATSVPAL